MHFGVARIGESSVTYEAEVVRDGEVVARGYSTSVCCEMGAGGKMASAEIPADIAEKLGQYRIEPVSDGAKRSRPES
jgi:acyl-CoA thioesterase FadM